MDWNVIAGNWTQYQGKVHRRWGRISSDHIVVIMDQDRLPAGKFRPPHAATRDGMAPQALGFDKGKKG
jgi:hypothetical protein